MNMKRRGYSGRRGGGEEAVFIRTLNFLSLHYITIDTKCHA